jgi:hypothetical protein
MSTITQEEMVALAAGVIGIERENAVGAVLVLAMADGQVAICTNRTTAHDTRR